MRIEEALSQVRVMQSQVARASESCCYRSATIAASGVGALVAALAQSYWVPDPVVELGRYLFLWVGLAILSVAVTGAEVLVRWARTESQHVRRRTITTVRQFVPCLVTGGLMTCAIVLFGREHAVMLPALWAIVFSLGVFASSKYLPSGSVVVAAYYLFASLCCLRWGQGEQSLAPWTMVVTFGAGQLLTAILLLRRQESEDGSQ